MNFLLVGHGGSYNRGCEAIIRSTLDMIRNEFKSPNIIISTSDFENERAMDFGPDVKIIPGQKGNDRWSLPWILRQGKRILSKRFKDDYWQVKYLPIRPYLKDADVVLSVGGDNFSMDYGFPAYFLGLNRLAKTCGKKVVIWSASIGPFSEDERLGEILNCLSTADLITVRESASVKYLQKFNITNNVRPVADSAFLLPTELVQEGWLSNGLAAGILGFNISPIYGQYRQRNKGVDICSESVRFLRETIKKTNMTVALIPHVTKKGDFNNDYDFMGQIFDELKETGRIVRVSDQYTACQMKHIISKCRFFIGARTHATIAALSSEVPTISLGYSLKARGINKDIFGCFDYMIEADDLTATKLVSKLNLMIKSEFEIRRILAERIPVVKKKAYQNIIFLKELLKNVK